MTTICRTVVSTDKYYHYIIGLILPDTLNVGSIIIGSSVTLDTSGHHTVVFSRLTSFPNFQQQHGNFFQSLTKLTFSSGRTDSNLTITQHSGYYLQRQSSG